MTAQRKALLAFAGAALVMGACSTDDVPTSSPILRRLTALLSPANETPPVTGVNSSGETRVTVRTERNLSTGQLDTAAVLVETLVSTIDSVTAAHIHAGAPGVAGPIIIGLTPTYGLVRGQRVARHLPDSSTTLRDDAGGCSSAARMHAATSSRGMVRPSPSATAVRMRPVPGSSVSRPGSSRVWVGPRSCSSRCTTTS